MDHRNLEIVRLDTLHMFQNTEVPTAKYGIVSLISAENTIKKASSFNNCDFFLDRNLLVNI